MVKTTKEQPKRLWVVAYDISKNKYRKKAADCLEGYGIRKNKSVFECMLTANELKKLKKELNSFCKDDTDTILFYLICKDCYIKSDIIGKNIQPEKMIVIS